MRRFRHLMIAAVAAGALAPMSGAAIAQAYPHGPVTLVVAGSAGSASDIIGRIVADGLSKTLGQSVLVHDLPAGGGTVAGATVAGAQPDGHTALLVNMSLTAAESLHPDRGYRFLEAFAPVGSFASSFFVYVVNPAVEVQTFDEFVTKVKAEPGAIDYSAAAVGTATFLATELLKSEAGLEIVHIPYNGGAPALVAVVSGETQFSAAPFPSVKPLIEAGELRALAVSAAERVPYLPDVPAVSETVPGFQFGSWYGIAVPIDTPQDVHDRLFESLEGAMNDPEVRQRLEDQGLDVVLADGAAFGEFLASNIETLGKIVEENKLTAQ